MELRIRPRALKQLARIPANVARVIRSKIGQLATNPEALANNIKALQGATGMYRLRVGDWRVIYTDDGTVIDIVRIAPRGSAYEE